MYVHLVSTQRIDTERLREQHPIAEVVGRYGIELRRSGSALVGRCPFHSDAGRPNLTVYPRSARFVCFRCQVRGDAIAFVQQIEQLSFREAVELLEARGVAHVSPRVRRPAPYQDCSGIRSNDEVQVIAAAVDLYANRLLGDERAMSYLAQRGFAPDFLERKRIGFAVGHELISYLTWRRLPVSAARRVGLLRADGREALAGRIVFPETRNRQPTWLIGRLLVPAEGLPRYLGLPGPKPLLGWDEASRDLNGVCLVEGPLDLLALQQWGIPGLAACGTGFSRTTLLLLGRWEHVYAALDADTAGQEAAARLVQALGCRVVRVALPSGVKDPAELAALPGGGALFRAAIRQAVERHCFPLDASVNAWLSSRIDAGPGYPTHSTQDWRTKNEHGG